MHGKYQCPCNTSDPMDEVASSYLICSRGHAWQWVGYHVGANATETWLMEQLRDTRTQLAAVTAERDRLREAVIQARDHTVSYAKYLREFHWSNTADEFDELRAKLNEALAATEPKGE